MQIQGATDETHERETVRVVYDFKAALKEASRDPNVVDSIVNRLMRSSRYAELKLVPKSNEDEALVSFCKKISISHSYVSRLNKFLPEPAQISIETVHCCAMERLCSVGLGTANGCAQKRVQQMDSSVTRQVESQ